MKAGSDPADPVSAFALYLSAFTTPALMIDFDQTPAQIGILTADVLKTPVGRAVRRPASPALSARGRRRPADGPAWRWPP
jgi:hypothetical protein